MDQWTDRFQDHELFGVLERLDEGLDRAIEGDLELNVRESLNRLQYVARYLRARLGRIDPALAPIKPLDSLANNLTSAQSEVISFIDSGSESHLLTAHTHLDGALQIAQHIPTVLTPEDVEGVRESIVEYRRSAGQHVRYLQQEVDAVRAHVSELKSQITKQKEQATADLAAEKAAVEEQIEAQKTEIAQQKARLDQAIQTFVEQSTEARERHSAKISELVAGAQEQVSAMLDEGQGMVEGAKESLRSKASEAITSIGDKGDALLKELQDRREKASEIVGIISRTGMAGGYQQEADDERKQADFWRWVTVASMLAIVALATWMVVTVATESAETVDLMAKAFASLTLGILAGYAGREAGKHRRREQRNRRLQLELSSIDAYLETLPDDERNAIKGALADRLFGNPDPPAEPREEGVRPASMMDLVRLFLPGKGT